MSIYGNNHSLLQVREKDAKVHRMEQELDQQQIKLEQELDQERTKSAQLGKEKDKLEYKLDRLS